LRDKKSRGVLGRVKEKVSIFVEIGGSLKKDKTGILRWEMIKGCLPSSSRGKESIAAPKKAERQNNLRAETGRKWGD